MFTAFKLSKYIAALAIMIPTLSSCDSAMYEGLDPCEVHHNINFVWDHNLLWADAFPNNVESVAVYAFNAETDVLVWQFAERGEALKQNGYSVSLDELPVGNYKVVAWCGLDNNSVSDETFIVPTLREGTSTLEDMYCRMEREIDRSDGTHHSSQELFDLWHGQNYNVVILDPTDPANRGDHNFTVNLKKNTNRVRIILQQLNAIDVDPNNFYYQIEEANGLMHHDNELMDDDMIYYHDHHRYQGTAGVEKPEDYPLSGSTRSWTDLPEQVILDETRAQTSVKVAVADLTMSRLKADRKSYLTIRNANKDLIAKVPLTEYALLVKDNYGRKMTDQEYLDRQDSYSLTFFLDRQNQWMNTSIIINSWRVVINPPSDF